MLNRPRIIVLISPVSAGSCIRVSEKTSSRHPVNSGKRSQYMGAPGKAQATRPGLSQANAGRSGEREEGKESEAAADPL
jgi:hypothetical protein